MEAKPPPKVVVPEMKEDELELENNESEHRDSDSEKLMPSILMLPDDLGDALVPMASDFVDEAETILTPDKQYDCF